MQPVRPGAGLPALLEAVLNVGTELELRSTLQHLVDSAVTLTGAAHGVLDVVDPGHGRLLESVSTGGGATDGVASLTVPIHVQETTFGRLRLSGKEFTDDDLGLLRVLATQAGIAIGNARLYETAKQRERWIEGAAEVTTALLTGRAEDALTSVAERARLLADAAAGVVLQPTEAGGMSIVAAATTADADTLLGTTIQPGSAVLTQLLTGEPVFIDDSATDPRMTTEVRVRFGPSMMLPLQAAGKLIGTLALPRERGARPYTSVDHLLATQFASQAALALVLADAQAGRERLAVFEDRDRIARDLHDLVVQRLFATGLMLESTQRRVQVGDVRETLARAVDELESTIQEVRTTIFALQQPPAEAPTTFRGRVLRETAGAAAILGFAPSVHFTGPVEGVLGDAVEGHLLTALRRALATASRRRAVSRIDVTVDTRGALPDGRPGVRLTVEDDGARGETPTAGALSGTTVTWQSPLRQ
ncbi:GAF domain-containing protein [Streptomyces sp. VRA16 Mangrove soil]|uniref:GAF domain-containing protein n=1 Tax=Streptomyces sp. VRA16 Mangrove soil TaxID=2817434 RepID=UPI001A9DAB29|nr:GAF domain-containing protein [Streptomyces sp. VRA16 Mangrove soil]MBO1336865.1 GAF domain-containing protein [Streptomyces sp. VRA16 Mangrove soil]